MLKIAVAFYFVALSLFVGTWVGATVARDHSTFDDRFGTWPGKIRTLNLPPMPREMTA